MLGRLMSPAFSSTLMHQLLRSRVSWRRKFIGGIFYYATYSALARLSLVLYRIRERRYATMGRGVLTTVLIIG